MQKLGLLTASLVCDEVRANQGLVSQAGPATSGNRGPGGSSPFLKAVGGAGAMRGVWGCAEKRRGRMYGVWGSGRGSRPAELP